LRFLAGFALLYGVLAVTSEMDASGRWGLSIMAAVVLIAVVVSRVLYGASPPEAVRQLGMGRPGGRALALAAAISILVLLLHPGFGVIGGSRMQLHPDWLWLVLGLFAFHGDAEELVWRGFAFRRLREGRTFWAAVCWTMPLIAATHLPIFFSLGPLIGLGAMLVAAVTSLPFSYLYEIGRNTVWAPALVHTAIDSFKLFVVPAVVVPGFSAQLIAVSLVVPLLVFVVPRRFVAGDQATSPARG